MIGLNRTIQFAGNNELHTKSLLPIEKNITGKRYVLRLSNLYIEPSLERVKCSAKKEPHHSQETSEQMIRKHITGKRHVLRS
jgi:hypothetical protein